MYIRLIKLIALILSVLTILASCGGNNTDGNISGSPANSGSNLSEDNNAYANEPAKDFVIPENILLD